MIARIRNFFGAPRELVRQRAANKRLGDALIRLSAENYLARSELSKNERRLETEQRLRALEIRRAHRLESFILLLQRPAGKA